MDEKKKRTRPDLTEMNRQKATHGMARTPTHTSWKNMRSRCDNPKDKDFPRYGGRGITYCDRWKYFANFLDDMGIKPDSLQIDRIDNNGNYEPGNCRWVDGKVNCNNRRNNVLITFNDETRSIADWARKINICPKTLRHRLVIGKWPLELALRGMA
jgi:hypothetical protein